MSKDVKKEASSVLDVSTSWEYNDNIPSLFASSANLCDNFVSADDDGINFQSVNDVDDFFGSGKNFYILQLKIRGGDATSNLPKNDMIFEVQKSRYCIAYNILPN